MVKRFDKPGTLFYVDPPYWANERDYGDGLFHREDFARLAELLDGIKGKFILSPNDVPGVRQAFDSFKVEKVTTRYSIAAYAKQAVGEVLITNF